VNEKKWWKEGVVYQIYPRSFQDSTGNGIGDLNGIRQRLDYLKELGIDIIWLSPIYKSPNDDNGYDISDYKAIMEEFGSMEDFDRLLTACHAKGIKLVMDLVVNHTSDEHPWFIESRKSKDNPYRDYYIWKDNTDGNPPNNWRSCFSGSAWQLDEQTNSYYLHMFSKKQCDLNWENKKVREDVYDLMRYWGEKGIDGFRMDVITFLSKSDYASLPTTSADGLCDATDKVANGPRIHEFLQEMNREVISHYDWMTVGEAAGAKIEDAKVYVNPDNHELNMIFGFDIVNLGVTFPSKDLSKKPIDLIAIKKIFNTWTQELDKKHGWNSLFWNNHDQPRAVSRFGNDSKEYRCVSAKMLALCLHMMKGTPYIYQGEELGMTNNYHFKSLSQFRDIAAINGYNESLELGCSPQEIMDYLVRMSRDNARTPMQWNTQPHAGFTTKEATPWIELNPNYKEINTESELKDPHSVFRFYQQLIELRHHDKTIVYGSFHIIDINNPDIFSYMRTLGNEKILVVCNFFGKTLSYTIPPEFQTKTCSILINNMPHTKGTLQPYEAFAIQCIE